MAKRTLDELEIIDFLEKEGFREVKEKYKQTEWYKIASERPICFENESKAIPFQHQNNRASTIKCETTKV